MKRPAPEGLCFPYANTALRLFGDAAVVVHARVRLADGRRVWHAWIEHEGRVYDWQTTERRGKTVPIETYYAVVKPRAITKYTPAEACINAVRRRHHGPWGGPWRGK